MLGFLSFNSDKINSLSSLDAPCNRKCAMQVPGLPGPAGASPVITVREVNIGQGTGNRLLASSLQ